jgi:hypothetical protein
MMMMMISFFGMAFAGMLFEEQAGTTRPLAEVQVEGQQVEVEDDQPCRLLP